MPWELSIAIRYVLMARKRAHTAFLSIISTLGLGVGVATLLISLALLSGLQGKIKDRLIAASPQILIEPAGTNSIENAAEVAAAIRQAGYTRIEAIIRGIAWGASERGKRGRPIQLRSFDEHSEPAADLAFGRAWEISTPQDRPSISLTRDYAASIGVALGEEITVIAPRTKLTPFGPVPVYRNFVVVRLLPSTADEKQPHAWLPYEDAARLFGTNERPTAIEAFGDESRAEGIRTVLAKKFPALLVKSWKEINRPLFLALRLEKIVMFVTISLIIFVAALNLISSLSMLIVEKRPHVGVLMTLGASERSILKIFLTVGLLIGLVGTVIGDLLGLGISWAANRFHLVPLPSEVYAMNFLPFRIDAADVVGVNVIALVLSVLATWYPARLASTLDPVVAIREE